MTRFPTIKVDLLVRDDECPACRKPMRRGDMLWLVATEVGSSIVYGKCGDCIRPEIERRREVVMEAEWDCRIADHAR